MGVIQAFTGALGGTFADQWKEIVTAGHFSEHSVVAPGILKQSNRGRGVNYQGSADVLSNGSKIFVPEGAAAFIFSQAGIEEIIAVPGGYEYQGGLPSVFNGDGFKRSIVDQTASRFGFGGQTSEQKQIAFVNLREIRGLKFGTRGPVVYHDLFYGADLEVTAFGSFSVRVVDVARFIRAFVPPNTFHYSFAAPESRMQILAEFVQSFVAALNALSSTFRVSQLPSQTHSLAAQISAGNSYLGSWVERFGLEVTSVGIESVELSPSSRELVRQYSSNMMRVKAYEGVSQQASNMAAQQQIAAGVEGHGLGDGGGMILGMNMAQGISSQTGQIAQGAPAASPQLSLDDQIEQVKKVKELFDAGIITDEEFAAKKKAIMGL